MLVNIWKNIGLRGAAIACLGLLAHADVLAQSTPRARTSAAAIDLSAKDWIHGAADCDQARAAPDYLEWQQVQYSADTYIFRQNKCSHYEAPFVYLLLGRDRGLLIDSGATEAGGEALLQAIRQITALPLIVAHSHGHSDHRMGDAAFTRGEAVSVVETGRSSVEAYFGFSNWPLEPLVLDLGERPVEVLPIPGHSDDDLAWYDPATQLLITGDSLYPGRLYVRGWNFYKQSIDRLLSWAEQKSVKHVLGTHIEMSAQPDVDYPVGTTYQPDEHPLPLRLEDLRRLKAALDDHSTSERVLLGSFIIWPL